jgi:hypothetical protein
VTEQLIAMPALGDTIRVEHQGVSLAENQLCLRAVHGVEETERGAALPDRRHRSSRRHQKRLVVPCQV